MSSLRFLVLGAAAGGGLPQWNCNCENCAAARDPSSRLAPQTQSSLAVSVDGSDWTILNASPDIRQQIERSEALHPRELRHSPVKSVILTNPDVDHLAGLLTLREKQAFTLFNTKGVSNILVENPIFRVLDPAHVKFETVHLETSFSPLAGMQITLFPVPGKVPLFMEDAEPEIGVEGEQTVGLEIISGSKRAFYVPGCAAVPEWLADRMRGADLVFFDGTVFADDEMIKAGAGTKTGRRMGHLPISGSDGSLARLGALDISRLIYIHINNTNPIWRDGPERDEVEAAGFQVGHDGMEVLLA